METPELLNKTESYLVELLQLPVRGTTDPGGGRPPDGVLRKTRKRLYDALQTVENVILVASIEEALDQGNDPGNQGNRHG